MKTKSIPSGFSVTSAINNRGLITAAYYIIFIIVGMEISLLGPALPTLSKITHSSLGDMSILFTVRSLGYLVGAFFVGRFFDRGAGHPLISSMLLITAILVSFIPLVSKLWVLTGLIFLLGLIGSAVDVGCNTFLVWVHREKVAPYMNGLHFFFGIGGFLSPILIAQVLLHTGKISWSFWFLGLLIIPVAIFTYFLQGPKPRQSVESVERPMKTADLKLFLIIIVFLSLFVGVEISFGGWIYSYGLTTGLTDKMGAAYLTSVFWGAFTVARLISIPLAIRLKPITMLFICTMGSLASFMLILSFPDSLRMLMLSSAGVGIFIACVFPTTFSFCEYRLGVTGKITSWLFVGASVGAMGLPWILGQLLDSHGPYSMMIAMASTVGAALIILSIIFFGFIRNKKPV